MILLTPRNQMFLNLIILIYYTWSKKALIFIYPIFCPQVDAPGRAVANPFIGVAVYGKNIPAMRIDVTECPFHDDIIDVSDRDKS